MGSTSMFVAAVQVVGAEIDDLEATRGFCLLPLTAGVLQSINGGLA